MVLGEGLDYDLDVKARSLRCSASQRRRILTVKTKTDRYPAAKNVRTGMTMTRAFLRNLMICGAMKMPPISNGVLPIFTNKPEVL